MLLAYLPLYLKSMGVGDSLIGAMISLFSLTTLLAILPVGFLSDRILAGRIIQGGVVFFLLYPMSLLLTEDIKYLFLGIFMGGIGSATIQVFLHSLFYKTMPQESRGKRVAFFFIGGSLGFSLGPLTGGIILTYFSIDMVFYLVIALTVFLFFLARQIQETLPLKFSLKEYGNDLLKPKVWFLLLSIFTVATHIGVEQSSYSLFLQQELFLTDFQIGLLYSIIGVWIATLSLVSGYLFDRQQRVTMVLSGSIFLSGVFQWVTVYAYGFWWLFGIRLLHTLGDAFYLTLNAILVSLVFPHERMGGNIGVIYTVHMLAIFAGALGSGFINTHYGYSFSFILSGMVMILVAILLTINRKRLTRSLEL
jgi:MFS family permease